MAWTKTDFYISLIMVVVVFFGGFIVVADSLLNSDRISLDGKSLDYISTIKGQNNDSGFKSVSSTELSVSYNSDILEGENGTQVDTSNDFLSTLQIKKERASRPVSFLKFVFNIPTSLVVGLGFSVNDWSVYLNVFGYVFVIAMLLLVWIKWVNA